MMRSIALVVSIGFALECRADGPININNFIDGVTRPINFPGTFDGRFDGTGVLGASWRAEFVAQDGTPIGDPVRFRSAGRLDFRAPFSADRIVTGTPGVPQNITVRVWDSSVFATWNDAETALTRGGYCELGGTAVGSSTFSYTIPAGTPPPIGADRILNFQSFNLTYLPPCPEPATTALCMTGAAVLLWRGFRPKRGG